MFELGEVLRDIISGFQGVALGRTDYHTGCTHYGLCPQGLKDGRPIEWQWFDVTRLERVEGVEKIVKTPRTPTGGPFPNAPQW